MNGSGIRTFWENVKQLPSSVRAAIFRHGPPVSDRSRAQSVFSNLFLHIHPARTHIRSLRFRTTLGMGVFSAALFAILAVTGILLMAYYNQSTELAYDSVKDIHYVVPSGWLVRNVHRWAAHLMVLAVFVHMARVFYTASYGKPREFNWVVGMGLFVVTLGLSFTGYLLPWDQLAFWAATIGANIAASPREVTDLLGVTGAFDPGGLTKEILLGASEVGQHALLRFYLLHVLVLPLALVLLLGVHFWRIRKDGGLARPDAPDAPGRAGGAPARDDPPPAPGGDGAFGLMCVVPDRSPAVNLDPAETVPSWPYLLRAELLLFMLAVLACSVLGIAFDAPLKEIANPDVPENPAKAPWYFLGLQELVSYSAFSGSVLVPGLTLLGLTLVPFLDRAPGPGGVYFSGRNGRRMAGASLLFGLLSAAAAVAVPVRFGWLRHWFPDIPQVAVLLVNPGTILTAAYAAWSVWVLRRSGSTRMAAMALFTCFLAGFAVLTAVGTYFRGPNWDFYWHPSLWPVH